MIITCIKCNKKFAVDDNLIPELGRVLQCGVCSHTWHYIPILLIDKKINVSKTEDDIKKDELISLDKNEQKIVHKDKEITPSIENDNLEIIPNLENNYEKAIVSNKKEKKGFLNKLLLSIIILVTLIIILDTFRDKLSAIFPSLNLYLDSLYNTITDISLFIISLIK